MQLSVSHSISLFSFQTFSWFTLHGCCIGWGSWWFLSCNVSFSFLMLPSPSLVISFETSDLAFVAGLLLSSLLAPFCSCCTSYEWVSLDGGWVIYLFSLLYFIVSSVSTVVFSKVVFGSSDVAHKNFWFLLLLFPFTSTRFKVLANFSFHVRLQ